MEFDSVSASIPVPLIILCSAFFHAVKALHGLNRFHVTEVFILLYFHFLNPSPKPSKYRQFH